MAKIVVSMYNFARHKKDYTIMAPFYEAFVNGLKEHGNDVLCYFFKEWNKNFTEEIPSDLLNELKSFDADLYIFFNNNFWDITGYFDKPILIYDVDSPSLYGNKEAIQKNPNKYKIICLQESNIPVIHEMFAVPQENVICMPSFTEIHNDKAVITDKNIVFVGANWTWGGCKFVHDYMKQTLSEEERKAAKLVYDKYMAYPFVSSDEIYKELGLNVEKKLEISSDKETQGRISGVRRLDYLNEIADLGLEIHGLYWDHEHTKFFPAVAMSYDRNEIFSLKENQELYNHAKIGFNISHIQAVSGFSWRVCDIMASNACIVTEYKSSFGELFPNLNIPMYRSKQEAHELCKKLLESPEERLDIVCQCNEIIDKNFRFIHLLEKMEDFMHMSLRNQQVGTLRFIHDGKPTENEEKKSIVETEKKIMLYDRVIRKTHHLLGKYLKNKGIAL